MSSFGVLTFGRLNARGAALVVGRSGPAARSSPRARAAAGVWGLTEDGPWGQDDGSLPPARRLTRGGRGGGILLRAQRRTFPSGGQAQAQAQALSGGRARARVALSPQGGLPPGRQLAEQCLRGAARRDAPSMMRRGAHTTARARVAAQSQARAPCRPGPLNPIAPASWGGRRRALAKNF